MSELIFFCFKINIGSCNLCFAIFCKYICVHGFDLSTNPILLKNYYTCYQIYNNCITQLFLSRIVASTANMYVQELLMFAYNL